MREAPSREWSQLDVDVTYQPCLTPELTTQPTWLVAAEALPEIQETAQNQHLHFLGGIALKGEVEQPQSYEKPNKTTLASDILQAAEGDMQKRKSIEINVATDIGERLYKAAHQSKIEMQIMDGVLQQENRRMVDIHQNTLEHTTLNPEMLRRAKHESRNIFVFQELHRTDMLSKYDAIVFSPASTEMNIADKQAYGMFTDTESCSIQRLSAEGDQVTFETAMVAGKRNATSERHDLDAINKLLSERGVQVLSDNGTDTIQHVILIPKGEIDGVEDVVAWYDQAVGGTFYGQDKPQQDYKQYAKHCEERSAGFANMVQAITGQLIREADTSMTPLEAIMRLDELSDWHCLERAIADGTLDEAVFGKAAAFDIQEARFFISIGDLERAEKALDTAHEKSDSSSCPLYKGGGGSSDSSSDQANTSNNDNEGLSHKKYMRCPHCSTEIYEDPCAKRLACMTCNAVVVNGKPKSDGDGGRRKHLAQQQRKPVYIMDIISQPKQPLKAKSSQLALAGVGIQN